jgi:hypothetical protein
VTSTNGSPLRRAPFPVPEARLRETLDAIAAEQLPSGCIPETRDGRADPWNHVEAAMALAAGGRLREAERAYGWLVARQQEDGSWARHYRDREVDDPTMDANVCAYVATGAWHHYLVTQDEGFLRQMWPVVHRAMEAVLELQAPTGEIRWARDTRGQLWSKGLITASSSVYFSLRCAVAAAERLGHERPDWELSAAAIAHAVLHRPEAFEDKDRWSMDWYYPVLSGILRGRSAHERIDARWEEFVAEGLGVRCVNDYLWITAAETCELVMALDGLGRGDQARTLFDWMQFLRADDGSYWMGHAVPENVRYPEEQPTWNSAAVILAADALGGLSGASGLFRGESLPELFELPEGAEDRAG